MATMLSIAQAVANEIGLAPINAVASSQSQDVIQILALMNAAGTELCMEHNWRALDIEYRFSTSYIAATATVTDGSPSIVFDAPLLLGPTNLPFVGNWMVIGEGIPQDTYISVSTSNPTFTMTQNSTASATGTYTLCQSKYALPSDYDRLVDRTQWDKTKHWELLGPESPQQWQWLKSGYIATGPRIRWRLLGNYFQLWPPISTTEYLGFEYISNGWAVSAAGTNKSSFTADDDTCIYPARVMILATKLKYFEIKGFDTTAMTRDYIRYLNIAKAEDAGAATLSFSSRPSQVLIGVANIPDSGMGT